MPAVKPEGLVLGTLTYIVTVLVVLSVCLQDNLSASGFLPRVAWLGLIAAQLLIATWVVWKGPSAAKSMEARLSPAWPVVIAGLLGVLALCSIVTYVAAFLLGGERMILHPDEVRITGMALLPAILVVGGTTLIGLLYRRRLMRFVRDMNYRSALSTILPILGGLAYFAVLAQLVAILGVGGALSNSLATLALLCGTWLVKGELQEAPTKALRFGLLFSVIFLILNLAAFAGLKALLA